MTFSVWEIESYYTLRRIIIIICYMLYEWDKRGLILSLWWVSWRDSRFLKKTIWCSVPPVCTGSALGNTILRVWVNLMAVNVVEGMDKGTHQGSRMRETAWKVCRQFVANHIVLRPWTYRWRQYTMCSGAGICRPAWLSYYFLKVLKWLKLGGFLLSFLVVLFSCCCTFHNNTSLTKVWPTSYAKQKEP